MFTCERIICPIPLSAHTMTQILGLSLSCGFQEHLFSSQDQQPSYAISLIGLHEVLVCP